MLLGNALVLSLEYQIVQCKPGVPVYIEALEADLTLLGSDQAVFTPVC